MDRVVSATEARVRFGELMRRVVEEGEAVTVERAGEPHVVVVSVGEYKRLKAAEQEGRDWKQLVAEAREQIQADLGDRELTPPPEDLIRQMREERSEQLTDLR